MIEGARVESLVRQALPFAPIDLSLGEPIWLYSLRENLDPRAWTVTPGGACVLFTSGFVPHAGNAQYSLAHWNYANYALHAT